MELLKRLLFRCPRVRPEDVAPVVIIGMFVSLRIDFACVAASFVVTPRKPKKHENNILRCQGF